MSTPTPPAVDLGRLLPRQVRQPVYAIFGIAAVVAFALDLAFTANPEWLEASLRVIGGLAPVVALLAAVNTPTGNVVSGSDATVVPEVGTSNEERHPNELDADDEDDLLPPPLHGGGNFGTV